MLKNYDQMKIKNDIILYEKNIHDRGIYWRVCSAVKDTSGLAYNSIYEFSFCRELDYHQDVDVLWVFVEPK